MTRPSGAASTRRGGLPATALVLLAVAAGAAGAAVGHELWTTAPRTGRAAPFPAGAGGSTSEALEGQPPFRGFGRRLGVRTFPGAVGGARAADAVPPDLAAIDAKVDPGLVDINSTFGYQSAKGAGTGMVLTPSGEILTNNHVIDGATKITATDVGNGKIYAATVLGYDPGRDVAVLQLQGASGLQTVPVDGSSRLAVGQAVVAVGNAGGLGGTPTSVAGTITALNQSIRASDDLDGIYEPLAGLIESNADVQPGDSGGSLVDDAGQVIGMDTAATFGFGFPDSLTRAYAIPVSQALMVAGQIDGGLGSNTVHVGDTAFLGVSVGFEGGGGLGGFAGFGGSGAAGPRGSAGAVISRVIAGDPAVKAGLTAGDVITSIDGESIRSASALSKLMLTHHPGDTIKLGWMDTAERPHTTTLRLASGPPA